jgi:hypothetical protein
VAIAAVALTIVTVGAAAPAAVAAIGGTVALGTAGAIAVGVTVGVVIGAGIAFAASALTQYLLVSGGLQDSWDWNQVAVDTAVGGVLGALAGGQAVFSALSVAGKVAALSRTTKVALAIGEASLDVAVEAASQAAQNNGRIPNPEYLGYSAAGAVGGEVLGRGIGAIASAVKKSRAVKASIAALESRNGLLIADDPIVGPRFEQVLREQSAGENLAFLKASRNLRDLDPSSAEARLEAERIQRVFVRDGDEELDYRATPAQLAEFKARAATEANTPVNIGSLTRENLLQSAPGSPKWFNDLAKADKEASSMLRDRVDPFRRLVEEEQLVPGYERDVYRPSAWQSVKGKAGSRLSAASSGAANALGSVRRGAIARFDAAGDVAAGVYASYKVNAGMKSASEVAAAAATWRRGVQRAEDVDVFAGTGITNQTIQRILNDADLGLGMRSAISRDFATESSSFLDDVFRLKSAPAGQQDAMARLVVDKHIRPNPINLDGDFMTRIARQYDDAGQMYSPGMFDEPERQVASLLKTTATNRSTNLAKFRKSSEVTALAARLKEKRLAPLDRLAAASPVVRSKSAQNALSAGYFDNQAAARATEFARFNIENASSPGDQFYAAWDNPKLRESVTDASTTQGKFQDETYVFALAARDYQRARLAQNAQGVTDALDKLSERISKLYKIGGFDDEHAKEAVLAVNMNEQADALFSRAIRNSEYDVLDRTLPVAVNKLLAADSIRQGTYFTNFGKFLNNNGLSGANLPTNPEVAEINKLLGIFGS